MARKGQPSIASLPSHLLTEAVKLICEDQIYLKYYVEVFELEAAKDHLQSNNTSMCNS